MTARSILFVHSADEAFGSDRVLLAMVDVARRDGLAVGVLLPDDTADGWLSGQLRARGVPVSKGPLAAARRRYLRPGAVASYSVQLVRAARFLRKEVRRRDPDLVHVSTSVLPAAAALRPGGRATIVWHVHELMTHPRLAAPVLRALPRLAAHEVVATSDAVARHVRHRGRGRARVHRIYNGLPDRAGADARPRATRTCVFAGRISHRKGYDLFVEVAARLAPAFPDATFAVAGAPVPGEEWRMDDLARRIDAQGLSDRVQVLGLCDDLPALFDRAHVAVFPTRLPEGFGLAMVEAMRSGCAVVASAHGAAAELLADGATGLLVAPGDVEQTAAAVARLLADDALRDQVAAAGRRYVGATFSEEQFASRIAGLWQGAGQVVAARRR